MTFSLKQFETGEINVVIITIFLFLALLNSTHCQEFECYKRYSSSEGLSQNIVNCMIQDSEGFLWIGTQDGLNCFDGYSFECYRNQPADSTTLSNNYVTSLCEDPSGVIWVGTMGGGLNRMNKLTRKFRVYQNLPEDTSSLSDNTVWALAIDKRNTLWAGTYKGLNAKKENEGGFIHYHHSDIDSSSLPDEMVLSLCISHNGGLWIGTGRGLAEYVFDRNNFRTIDPEGRKTGESVIWSLSRGSGNEILSGTNNGVWGLDEGEDVFRKLTGSGKNDSITVWSVLAEGDHSFWYGTTSGIYSYDMATNKPGNLQYNLKTDEIPDEINVWCLLRDNSGTLWAGTGEGLFAIRSTRSLFRKVTFDTEGASGQKEMAVNAILRDSRDQLWIGTEGSGLYRMDGLTGKTSRYLSGSGGINTISGDYIWSLFEDSKELMWIGTYGAGLNSFARETGNFISYRRDERDSCAITNNRIFAILEDRDGKVWIGTRGSGLNRFDRRTGCFEEFSNDPADSTSLSSNIVLSLAMDKEGRVWVGTFDGGLCSYNRVDNTFRAYRNTGNGPAGMPDNCVWSILFGNNNRLWLGTQSGLYVSQYDSDKLDFRYFTTRDGLPGNVIIGLAEDHSGNIWMSTFKGIAKLNIEEFERLNTKEIIQTDPDPFHPLFNTYDSNDGLAGNEFSQGAYFRAEDGTIYFGGPKGLNYFHPDSLLQNRFDPPVKITGFKIFNREVQADDHSIPDDKNYVRQKNGEYFLPAGITYLNDIVLTWRESVFSFEFAALDYSNPAKNKYAYSMEGFEKDWNFIGNQTLATYTNLDPGKYIFRVRGTNSAGKWSANEATLSITILPPYWRTSWFIVLMIVAFASLLSGSVIRIIRNRERKALAEKEKMELQLKTIKNQIDPHFAFNAINMIGSMVYKNDPDMVYDYFSRFARLIRSTLQDSEKISRPLSEELDFVKNYVEIQKTRFAGKFAFQLEVGNEVDLNTEVPKMIIQTYTENAIKHGLMHRKDGGSLSIDIGERDMRMTITVEDNGIGREKAATLSKDSTKKGMQIIRQIFALYNKLFKYKISQEIIDLKDADGNALGTKVVLTIDKN
jgi:ligand-binding sensor domain-containing protein